MACLSRAPSSPSCSGAALSSGVSIGPGATALARTPIARRLARDRLREADDAGLRRGVGRRPLRADAAGLARDVHDHPAAALVHRRQHGVRDGEDAAEVDAEDEVPQLRVGVDEEREAVGARVVDEDVDRPERVGGRRHGRGRPRPCRRRRAPSRSRRSRRRPRGRRRWSRSATATRAPSAASRRAVAAPMPPAPPVTSAVRPSRRMAANPILAALAAPVSDHRRHRRARLRARPALGAGRRARRHRLARRRPRREAAGARAAACPDGDVRRGRERRGRRPRPTSSSSPCRSATSPRR